MQKSVDNGINPEQHTSTAYSCCCDTYWNLGCIQKCLAPFSVVVEDFKTSNICIDNCVYYDACDVPTSVVIINQSNGSRTIIHSNNNLPELTLDDFKKLDLSQYSWIHFEASSLVRTVSVMQTPNTCLTSSV